MTDIAIDNQNQVDLTAPRRRDFKLPIALARNSDALQEIDAQVEQLTKNLEPELDIEKITHVENKEKLEAIMGKENTLTKDCLATGLASTLIRLTFTPGFSAVCIPIDYAAFKLLEKAQRLQQVKNLMHRLLEKFEGEGIEIFPCLELENLDCVDLFIRFPTRYFFMVSFQFIGKNTLFYSKNAAVESQKDGLYLRNDNGRRKKFKSEKLNLLPAQERHLRQQYKNILGGSNKDTKSAILKILALCGKDAKLTSNFPSWLTEKNESGNYYFAQKNPSIFVMREEEVINFIDKKIKIRRF
jgi:hypothetical protein